MRFWTRLFTDKKLQDQAGLLAADFARTCPPPDNLRKLPVPEQHVQAALQRLYQAVAAYSQAQHLGVLRRAMLARAFQQEMLDMGYASDMVSKVVGALTVNALVKR